MSKHPGLNIGINTIFWTLVNIAA
ncbi:hypothetical protein TRIP_C60025 [Candidatus Zixiibacteriota bacterium]|nr:hypothetical protein TRIP_C60025 [candidate division Zixibacteria bacterium]